MADAKRKGVAIDVPGGELQREEETGRMPVIQESERAMRVRRTILKYGLCDDEAFGKLVEKYVEVRDESAFVVELKKNGQFTSCRAKIWR